MEVDADAAGSQGDGEAGKATSADQAFDGKRTLPKPQAFTFFKHSVAAGRDAAAALKDTGIQHREKLHEQAKAAAAVCFHLLAAHCQLVLLEPRWPAALAWPLDLLTT